MHYVALDVRQPEDDGSGRQAPYGASSGTGVLFNTGGYTACILSDRRNNRDAGQCRDRGVRFGRLVNPEIRSALPNAAARPGEDINGNSARHLR